MKTWLVCYVINYTETIKGYANYLYKNESLDTNDLISKLSKFCKDNYGTDRVGITNIIKMDN